MAACQGTPERPGAPIIAERDSAGVRLVELSDVYVDSLPWYRVEERPWLSIGEASGPVEYELFDVTGATTLPDGSVAVANAGSAEVRIFNRDGRFVRAIGRQGQGPGEFVALAWLGIVDPDTIMTFDSAQRRVTWFTSDGEVARTLTLGESISRPEGAGFGPMRMEPLGAIPGGLVVRSGFQRRFCDGECRDAVIYGLHSTVDASTQIFGAYLGPELYFYRAPSSMTAGAELIFGRDTHADAFAGRLVIGSSDLFELDVFDGPSLSMKVRANVHSHPVTTEEVEMWREVLRESGREIEGEFGDVIQATIDRLPFHEAPPAFRDLIVDSERFHLDR